MDPQTLFEQCRSAAKLDPEAAAEPDSLIGMFQTFRPDGDGLDEALGGLSIAGDLYRRLERLYRDSGEDRRPQGGRDAYFIVRRPRPLDPVVAESTAQHWIDGLASLAKWTSSSLAAECLSRDINVRVLEGIAPKHPKDPGEKCKLLATMENSVPELLTPMVQHSAVLELLRPAYYFIACDAHLRDYLMWPLYLEAMNHPCVSLDSEKLPPDPFAAYYDLWRHGVKYRIFSDDQIDLYLPRQAP